MREKKLAVIAIAVLVGVSGCGVHAASVRTGAAPMPTDSPLFPASTVPVGLSNGLHSDPNADQAAAEAAISNLPSTAALESMLDADHVSVFVNGAEIANEVLAETIGGLQQQAVRLALVKKISADPTLLTGPDVASAAAAATTAARATATQPAQFAAYERTAISVRVLRALLFVYAQTHGLVESNGAAAVKAQENLQQWEASGSPPMKPLPNGVSGAAGFTSPGAVHALAVADSIDAAETAIAGPSMDSAHRPRNRAPELAKWFTGALQGAAVSIVSDTPGVSSSADGSVAPSAVVGWLPATL